MGGCISGCTWYRCYSSSFSTPRWAAGGLGARVRWRGDSAVAEVVCSLLQLCILMLRVVGTVHAVPLGRMQ